MENFEIRLKEFSEKCKNLQTQEFENFGYLEKTYCDLINEGNQLRQYVIQNPEICDKKSLLVLTNQVPDISLLDENFKSLTNILQLTVTLLQKYSEYVQTLMNEQKFEEAINIYSQMYKFTRNPIYKKIIAEIYCSNLNEYDKALEVLKSIEDIVVNNPQYCRVYAKIYSLKSDVDNTAYYNRRADELEMIAQAKDFIDKKDYTEAIQIYDNLFQITQNYNYQIEIANIHAVCLSNVNKAMSIYKHMEKHLENDAKYWWQRSQLYENKENLYKQVLCIQKAVKLELNEIQSKEASV